jgi:K+-sensing histidine kinase KdpD
MIDVTERANRTAIALGDGDACEMAPISANRLPRREHSYPAGSLAASIVHDLRHPVATICGCAELLLNTNAAPGSSWRIARNIHRAASALRALLADLVRITGGLESRGSQGKM